MKTCFGNKEDVFECMKSTTVLLLPTKTACFYGDLADEHEAPSNVEGPLPVNSIYLTYCPKGKSAELGTSTLYDFKGG